MSLLRHTTILAAALLLAGTATLAHADDVSMADGSVHFTTPANWVDIMQTTGDPEVHVFQVTDPSPTASTSLARITVTVKKVADLDGFNTYRSGADAKARGLTGYQPGVRPPPRHACTCSTPTARRMRRPTATSPTASMAGMSRRACARK